VLLLLLSYLLQWGGSRLMASRRMRRAAAEIPEPVSVGV
jgi:hypothetical protein